MVLELRQSPKLAQQMVMTPQLQQAIKLLQLSRLEFQQAIREELEINPALEDEVPEEDMEGDLSPSEAPDADGSATPEDKQTSKEGDLIDRIDWEYYFGESGRGDRVVRDTEEEDSTPYYENTLTRRPSLSDHLEMQIRLLDISESEREAALYLIGNIDEDGYLTTTVEEAAQALGMTIEEMSGALDTVQTLDPLGVGARNLQECLMIQAKEKGEEFDFPRRILENHFDMFSKGKISGIARILKIDQEVVKEAFQKLVTLWPRPGRAYSEEDTQYISPDVHVFKMDDQWVISLNEDGMPRIRLSSFYKHLLDDGKSLQREERDFLRQKVSSALWFIKSIEQRKRTIYRVVESIIKLQNVFFEKGVKFLRPLTLRDVAEDIEMHESTISRATSGKYVHTPHGTFELKYFFNSGLNRGGGEGDIASGSVKEKIREIIRSEGESMPLSDQELMRILHNQGIRIARRTVTKYRAQLGLLSSSVRRRQF
ncbi:MAG: RNA polymerase factor sigma-54 [Syntrophorhabdaceae bacterium]|nr:RNA polymerase factor sigma-54 [Syntrophorhabdaceae bacterium]